MRMYLASVSSLRDYHFGLLPKIKYALESFLTVKRWMLKYIQNEWKDTFMLDSGAASLIYKKKSNVSYDTFLKYTNEYIEFIAKYDITHFFEMDVDVVIGLSAVEKLRDHIEKETGKKTIPVWHPERGKDYYVNMCKEYPYVAIGGLSMVGTMGKDDQHRIADSLRWFANTAHKHGAKLHVLGISNTGDFQITGLDSVDCTTWLSAGKYGRLMKFDGTKIVTLPARPHRGISWNEMTRGNLIEWIKFQHYADSLVVRSVN